jgi:hypothetical protein
MNRSDESKQEPALAKRRGRRLIWFGFLGGALAWLAHLVLAWGIAEFGCIAGLGASKWLGIPAMTVLLGGLTASALGIALAAAWATFRVEWRMLSDNEANPLFRGAAMYLSRSGLVLNGLFVLVIIAQSFPIFFFGGNC